jgi:2-oxoglutarate ferredoxin oxidoreductase subunit beta
VRQHNEAVNRMDFIESRDEITTQYAPGEVVDVPQHDGTVIRLRKLAADYDPTDRIKAMNHLQQRAAAGEVVTGLLYIDAGAEDLHEHLHTVGTPLNQLGNRELCPGAVALERINASLR